MKKSILILAIIFNLANCSVKAQYFLHRFNNVLEMVVLNEGVILIDDSYNGKNQVWWSDGSLEGTTLLKTLDNNGSYIYSENLILYKNDVYFAASDKIHGIELWKTDGSVEGTKIFANIKPDLSNYNNGSLPRNFTIYGDELFFTASDDGNNADLWKTNGTLEGTIKVFETEYVEPHELKVVGDYLFFVKTTGGGLMYKHNKNNNTTISFDIDEYYTIAELNSFKNELYFITHTTYRRDIRLYRLRPEDDSFVLIKEFTSSQYGDIDIDNFIQADESVFFSLRTNNDNNDTDALWKTDGTADGTTEIKSFPWSPHSSESWMGGFAEYKNKLFFASSSSDGRHLWTSDGTSTSTFMVKDVSLYLNDGHLTKSNDLLFFRGNGELWSTDGSEAGTELYTDIQVDGFSRPHLLVDNNGLLYFIADDGFGKALWTNKPSPKINLRHSYNEYFSGETYNFISDSVDKFVNEEFIVENLGLKELVISEISVAGSNFYTDMQKNILLPGETDTLDISFFPLEEGLHRATITIKNNDNSVNEFKLNLQGTSSSYLETPFISDHFINLQNFLIENVYSDTFQISKSSISEYFPLQTVVGEFEVIDENISDYTFSLVSGLGDSDNGCFSISGNKLYTEMVFKYELQNTYICRIKAKKDDGLTYEKAFIFRIIPVSSTIEETECGKSFTSLSYSLNDVTFLDNGFVFAVGSDGVIIKSTDGGINWEQINSGTNADLSEIHFPDQLTAYVLKRGGSMQLLKSSDGGEHWFPIEFSKDSRGINNMFFTSAQEGYLVGDNGYIFKTVDGGRSWEQKKLAYEDLVSVFFVNETTGFIADGSNSYWKTTDAGNNWTEKQIDGLPFGEDFRFIYFLNEQTGLIVCDEGTLFKSSNGGDTWNQVGDLNTYPTDIKFINEQTGFISGGFNSRSLYKTTNAGESWEKIFYNVYGSLSEIAFSPEGNKGIGVGDGAGYGSSSESGRLIMTTNDWGNNWEDLCFINGSDDFYEMAFFEDNIAYVFGGDYSGGVAYKSYDNGISWSKLDLSSDNEIQKCSYLTKDTIIAHSTDLYLTTNGGVNWSVLPYSDSHSQFHFIDMNTIIKEKYGDIYKSNDGGETWDMVYESFYNFWSMSFYNNLGFLVNFNFILKTEDGGESWQQYDFNSEHYFLKLSILDNDTYIVAGNEGMLLKTEDGGESWVDIPSIITTDIDDIKFFDDQHGLAIASSMYETFDAGESWEEIHFLMNGANKLFLDKNQDAYLGGDRGSFQKYSHNLPPSQAGYIYGKDEVCLGDIQPFYTPDINCLYSWELNGSQDAKFDDHQGDVSCINSGEFSIEVTPYNGCGEGISRTLSVMVNELPSPIITGIDSLNQNQTEVIYSSNDHPDSRLLWSIKGEKSAEIVSEEAIIVDWGMNANSEIVLIHTDNYTLCRNKDLKSIYIIGINGEPDTFNVLNAEVYPIPFKNHIDIRVNELNNYPTIIYLYEQSGKLVYNSEVYNSKRIDLSNLPSGMYILKLVNNDKTLTKKIIKN